MAETVTGYDTTGGVLEADWANLSPHLGAIFPTISTAGTNGVTAGTASMTVDVSAGVSSAFGVRHNITTVTNLTIAPVTLAGAIRWDAVVKRFNWGTNSAPLAVVQGTAGVAAPKVEPSGLFNTPGDKYDQVLALVKATNGSTALEIADRRIWGSKQYTVATVDAIPTATTAHKGASFYVASTDETYHYSEATGSPSWKAKAATQITELTGAASFVAATGWTWDATRMNKSLIGDGWRSISLEIRRSGAEINAANADGNFTDTVIGTVASAARPEYSIPVFVTYFTTDGKEFGGSARLDPNGTLMLLDGAVARNVAQSTAVGFVSLRVSIFFGRRTA